MLDIFFLVVAWYDCSHYQTVAIQWRVWLHIWKGL